MAINYNDSRFTELEKDKNAALNQSNSTYDNLMSESKGYYDNLIAQSKDYEKQKVDMQNQLTEFAIDKIEKEKAQAEKDYTKEQKANYAEYMKQINPHGSTMQNLAQQGLAGEVSDQVRLGYYNAYNTNYQNAKDSYNEIIMNYNDNIKEAQLQNSSALIEIYNQAQAEQLELALQSFTVIKDLTLNKQKDYLTIDDMYNTRWRQVEQQINTENALAEEIRQYNASLAEQKRQADMDQAYRNASLALEREKFNYQKAQDAKASAGGSGGSGGSGGTGGNTKAQKDTGTTTAAKTKSGGSSSFGKDVQYNKNYNTLKKQLDSLYAKANSSSSILKVGLKQNMKAQLNKAVQEDKITAAQFKKLASKYGF